MAGSYFAAGPAASPGTDRSAPPARLTPAPRDQVALHSDPDGMLGPWSGLGVAALWAGAALLWGAWRVGRRDA
ncbi:hypothetical protein ACGFZL_09185 [Streptomyces sp. NPDC048182]|uniref:hypothetical protein n=1 Tax=Streptomyces sp. NPDC048182 TaxID=3365507 RepID=UPI003719FBE7